MLTLSMAPRFSRSREPAVFHLQNPSGELIDSVVVGDNHDAAILVEQILVHEARRSPVPCRHPAKR